MLVLGLLLCVSRGARSLVAASGSLLLDGDVEAELLVGRVHICKPEHAVGGRNGVRHGNREREQCRLYEATAE